MSTPSIPQNEKLPYDIEEELPVDIVGIFGNIFGGYVTKKMVDNRISTPINAKRILISICAICAAVVVILIPFVHGIMITLTLLTLALCFISAITGSAWALAGDIAPPALVASVGSIQNFGGYFGGAFSPVVALCYWFYRKKSDRGKTSVANMMMKNA